MIEGWFLYTLYVLIICIEKANQIYFYISMKIYALRTKTSIIGKRVLKINKSKNKVDGKRKLLN